MRRVAFPPRSKWAFAFSPRSKEDLEQAVHWCIRVSLEGDCSKAPHGPIGKWDVSRVGDMRDVFSDLNSFNGDISEWDVSRVTDMSGMFASANVFNGDISRFDVSNVKNMYEMFHDASSFNGDISTWDVSSVKDMSGMFGSAKLFNGDISKWDVSRVRSMHGMFLDALSFNDDISRWDVSSVVNMDFMFKSATSFKQTLCGDAWVHSKASKINMFAGSHGSISRMVCMNKKKTFSPQSKAELKGAIDACLQLSPKGDCSNGPHGAIGDWDVSSVDDMSQIFFNAKSFNGDISKWDVSIEKISH